MNFSTRPWTVQDHDAIMALYSAAKPLGLSPPSSETDNSCRFVSESEAGQVIGYGAAPGQATSSLQLWVHPQWQRRGVGAQLWERLRADLAARGVAAVEPWVRQENAAGISWLEKQGFTQINQDGPVHLLLPGADLRLFAGVTASMAAQGITVTTLAEEKVCNSECLTKLYALYTAVEADVPGNDPAAAPPLEDFVREWEQPDQLLFLAKNGERYVGLSTAAPRDADPFVEERHDIFQQYLTGVLPEYRRRGIATALKLRVIAHAQSHGYRTVWTNSGNPAMRALNKKLGFRTGPWLVYRKTLE